MIEVKIIVDRQKQTAYLRVKGHAGQAEPGKDIICAAASVLSFTVAQIVKDMYDRRRLRKKPVLRMENGDTTIICKPKEKYAANIYQTFAVAQTGYKLLAYNYPQYVCIVEKA